MQELLAKLKTAGYEMHVLSNYSTWYQLIEDKLQLSQYLRWSFVSCLVGVRKPDPQAYLCAAEALHVGVGDCLLIDDRIVNVEAAQDLGTDAILAESSTQILAELARRRILSA
jgi:HAD superfamily hydrolase (TIGR01509 family)